RLHEPEARPRGVLVECDARQAHAGREGRIDRLEPGLQIGAEAVDPRVEEGRDVERAPVRGDVLGGEPIEGEPRHQVAGRSEEERSFQSAEYEKKEAREGSGPGHETTLPRPATTTQRCDSTGGGEGGQPRPRRSADPV